MNRVKTTLLALTGASLAACATPAKPVGSTYTISPQKGVERAVDTSDLERTIEAISRADIGISEQGFQTWLSRNQDNTQVRNALTSNTERDLYLMLDTIAGTEQLGHYLDCGSRGDMPSDLASYSISDDRKAAVAFNYLHGLDTPVVIDPQERLDLVTNAGYRVEACLDQRADLIRTAVADNWKSYGLGVLTGLIIGYNIPNGGGNGGGDSIGLGSNTNTGGPTF